MALLVALATAAQAERKAKQNKDLLSIEEVRDSLVLLRTDGGHYVAIVPFDVGNKHFYFGDGKHMYLQRSAGGSKIGAKMFQRPFWSPRTDNHSYVQIRDGAWKLKCKDRETAMAVVDGDEASKLLVAAKFHGPLWKRRAYALARDDRGRYYYLDRLRDAYGGKGYRLFVGMKGSMKKTKLVNVVSDSEGDIFSTKKGDLRLIWDRGKSEKVTWVRGKKRIKLTPVPLWKNSLLVYDELGVYEGELLGTPCDYY